MTATPHPPEMRRSYNFKKPLGDDWIETNRSLSGVLTATAAFKRLRGIRFLGAIDYSLIRSPNYGRGNFRHSRFQHSLGVARLAVEYARLRDLAPNEARTVFAAALLHDIGHPPLSHSLEPIFETAFGFGHHKATIDIIAGRVPLGREVYGLLRDALIDVEHVIALISGEDSTFDQLFSGPINLDTVDGVLRSHSYVGRRGELLDPHTVICAAVQRTTHRDQEIVDLFWEYKDKVYTSIINSQFGVISDYLCQTIVTKSNVSLSIDDYYGTDERLFRRIPGLREALEGSIDSIAKRLMKGHLQYKARRFYVDGKHAFFSRDDRKRYSQLKETREFDPSRRSVSPAYFLTQDVFDDDDLSGQLSLF